MTEFIWVFSWEYSLNVFIWVVWYLEYCFSYILMWDEWVLFFEYFGMKEIFEFCNLLEYILFIKDNILNLLFIIESEWCYKVILKII